MEHKFYQPNKNSWFYEVSVNKSEQSWNVEIPRTIKNSFLLFKSFLKLYFKRLIFLFLSLNNCVFSNLLISQSKLIDFTEQIDWFHRANLLISQSKLIDWILIINRTKTNSFLYNHDIHHKFTLTDFCP